MSSSTSSPTNDLLAVARVMGVRGLGGELRVMPLTDAPERLAAGALVLVEGEETPRRIAATGPSRQGVILSLDGITDRDVAKALVGRHLLAPGAAPELPAGTYWWHQLEGLDVIDENGRSLGRLDEVFRVGSNEVYRVVGAEGELLVPALHSVVTAIDLDTGRMTIRDPGDWLEEV
jgi:16S rRNA processing protein RimM